MAVYDDAQAQFAATVAAINARVSAYNTQAQAILATNTTVAQTASNSKSVINNAINSVKTQINTLKTTAQNNLNSAIQGKLNEVTGVIDQVASIRDQIVDTFQVPEMPEVSSTEAYNNLESYVPSTSTSTQINSLKTNVQTEINEEADSIQSLAYEATSLADGACNIAENFQSLADRFQNDPQVSDNNTIMNNVNNVSACSVGETGQFFQGCLSVVEQIDNYGDITQVSNFENFINDAVDNFASDMTAVNITEVGGLEESMEQLQTNFLANLRLIVDTARTLFTALTTVLNNTDSYGNLNDVQNFSSFQEDSLYALREDISNIGQLSYDSKRVVESMFSDLDEDIQGVSLATGALDQIRSTSDGLKNVISGVDSFEQQFDNLVNSTTSLDSLKNSIESMSGGLQTNLQMLAQSPSNIFSNISNTISSCSAVRSLNTLANNVTTTIASTTSAIFGNTSDIALNVKGVMSSVSAGFSSENIKQVVEGVIPFAKPTFVYNGPSSIEIVAYDTFTNPEVIYVENKSSVCHLNLGIKCTHKNFSVKNCALSIPPMSAAVPIVITFRGDIDNDSINATLLITSNDPDNPEVEIQMTGTTMPPARKELLKRWAAEKING